MNKYHSALFAFFVGLNGLHPGVSLGQTPPVYTPWQEDTHKTDIEEQVTHTGANTENEKTAANFDSKKNEITKPPSPSRLETYYESRIGTPLTQYGYDLFDSDDLSLTAATMGAVSDAYIVGAGDSLTVTFTGQKTGNYNVAVNTSGTIILPYLPPIPAAGHSLEHIRTVLNAHISNLHNTQAYLSLSTVRQINVLVVGHVGKPGLKTLSAFHSVLDAIRTAEGIRKDGSMRMVKLVRNGRNTVIDLYALLQGHGASGDLQLRDGDRIIIPPIGPTIAVTGAVKRPAIYEIEQKNTGFKVQTQNKGKPLSLNEALSLSGGIISQGQYRYIARIPTPTGKENITEVPDLFSKIFTDGTILGVESSTDKKSGQVELAGNTNRPGLYDLNHYKTLRDLLKNSDVLGDDIYPLLGVIKRWDKTQLATTFKSFSVRVVLDNEFDINLSEGDTVLLFNNNDITDIYIDTHKKTDRIESAAKSTEYDKKTIEKSSPLEHFIKEQSVQIRGAVRAPGTYPIAPDIPLDHLLAVAGGMSSHADLEAIEITRRTPEDNTPKRTIINSYDQSLSDIYINAGDTIRINQKREKLATANTVKIFGEVKRPGEYDLMAGDTVLDILERAGGLSAQAYPAGSIFSRESERKSEEMRFRNAARDMQARLASAIENDKTPPNAAQIEMVSALSEQLSTIEAVGRITVETNPDILETQPELNMLLEAGDRIYIPKRPLTVRVSGEVLSPSSLQFRKEKDPIDYIREAGNFSYHADKDRAFVVYPNGSAQPLQVNTWNHKPVFIPPGSTIVVPRDPKPFDFIEGAKEISQILSNIAITSVFIDDIRD